MPQLFDVTHPLKPSLADAGGAPQPRRVPVRRLRTESQLAMNEKVLTATQRLRDATEIVTSQKAHREALRDEHPWYG